MSNRWNHPLDGSAGPTRRPFRSERADFHPPTPTPVISARHRPIGDCMAFTLVELLAVITIVAVLAALVIPSVSSAFRKGYEADAAQDLSSLYQATMLYAAENNGEMFFCMDSGGPLGWRNLWPDKLTPYLPAAGTITHTNGRNVAFYNKGIKMANRWLADYAPNDNVLRENNQTWQNFPTGAPRMISIRQPSKEILYLEGANNDKTKNPRTSGAFSLWSLTAIEGKFDYPNTIARRHGPALDPAFYAIFCDGRVERINFNAFATNRPLRQEMLSGTASGHSIYP